MKRLAYLAWSYRNPSSWVKNVTWRRPRTLSDLDCVFVVGAPRSGTTLLQRVLSSHSQLFSIEGETGLFSLLNLFNVRHFGLPQETLDELFQSSVDVVDFFSNGVRRLMLDHPGARFIEKTPQHVLRTRFLLKHFPRAKIVNIVRDGRDCFCSAQSHPHIPQARSIAGFARYWRSCIRAIEPFADSPRLYTMRYETFCDQPESELQKVMQFLDLEFEAGQLDANQIGNDRRAAAAHFERLNESVGSRSVARWRKELPEAQAAAFVTVAGRELRRFGYEASAS
ncbi:MAG: sulfotransferase [Planctomycetota bacterium]